MAGLSGNHPQRSAAASSGVPPPSVARESIAPPDTARLRLRVAALSVIGPVRGTNEDHVGWFDASGLDLAGTPGETVRSLTLVGSAVGVMMADGLGGHGRGDLASRTATRIVIEALARAGPDRAGLVAAIQGSRHEGISGAIAFDEKGDIRDANVTMTRARAKDRSFPVVR